MMRSFEMNKHKFYLSLYSKQERILLVGVLPPPIGGVSIHCSRLLALLQLNNYQVDFFDLNKNGRFKYSKEILLFFKLLFSKYTVVHSHSANYKINWILNLMRLFKRYKIYFTNHNPRLFFNPQYQIKFFKKYIAKLDQLILVSRTIYEVYEKNSVQFPRNVMIQNAYLPPNPKNEDEIVNSYPEILHSFIKDRHPLIIANASVIMFQNGVDVYGLDMCIDLTIKLKRLYPNIGFIFAIANPQKNYEYLIRNQSRFEEGNILNNFLVLTLNNQIWPLFKRIDLMIRPTYSDGMPLSILEAMDLGCQVIASDSCQRPNGVICFKNRDSEDLFEKVNSFLMTRAINT